MPQVCLESAAQPSSPANAGARRSPRRRTPRAAVVRTKIGPPLSILGTPSPTIGDTCTTHNQMLFWVGWFARFHIDPEGPPYVPYEIKSFDCPVVSADGSPVLRNDGKPRMTRCIREVAWTEVKGEVEWLLISWEIGVSGMTIQKCATLDKAILAFQDLPRAVTLPETNPQPRGPERVTSKI